MMTAKRFAKRMRECDEDNIQELWLRSAPAKLKAAIERSLEKLVG